jgi:TetR/AcrR family transcriptional repressor of nem operon
VSQEQKKLNRKRIVDAAAAGFRARGIDNFGIDDLTKSAGMTHGGFYNHFASKDDLAVEVFRDVFDASLAGIAAILAAHPRSSRAAFQAVLDNYLSALHRDHPEFGCASAALVSDAGRRGPDAQAEYQRGLEGYLEVFIELVTGLARQSGTSLDPARAREEAIAVFTQMVGSLVVARAVAQASPELSDEIITSSRRQLKRR